MLMDSSLSLPKIFARTPDNQKTRKLNLAEIIYSINSKMSLKDAPLYYIPLRQEKKFLLVHSCKMPLTVVYILISEMLKCKKVIYFITETIFNTLSDIFWLY